MRYRNSSALLRWTYNCSVLEAAQRSGIDREFPTIDWATAQLGIFGNIVEQPAQQLLRDGDRIEIYRPLLIDPKAVRKQRADQKQSLKEKLKEQLREQLKEQRSMPPKSTPNN
jgi:putative ubiquitin-RnfH superfamily antitoxin RatB of RatAB toxin-antitoxin module